MNRFQTIVGIDPSGRRLAVAAVRSGFGPPALSAPPLVADLRSEKEQQWMEEAEGALGDFVARNGLAGSAARLCVPADRVYTARVSFPPIREKDLLPALELELERLFPFPSSRLRFGWRRLSMAPGGKDATFVVAAALSDYLEGWEGVLSRAGLRLAGAIPAGWALSSALSRSGGGRAEPGGLTAILRDAGDAVECSVLSAGVPLFSASRRCAAGSMPAEGFSLLAEGLVDIPSAGEDAPVDLFAPPDWFREGEVVAAGGTPIRPIGDFPPIPSVPVPGPGGADEGVPARGIAGAFGAAAAAKAIDLAAPDREAAAERMTRLLAWGLALVALLLAHAWPATLYWRASAELARIDARIAALKPVVGETEKGMGEIASVGKRISLLREAADGRGEAFLVLKELTERLPEGTWLTGLRVEDRQVEIDGLSPSANEIFPLLARDGRFRGVAFASPITRQADNLERFRIQAEFVPAAPPGTEAAR